MLSTLGDLVMQIDPIRFDVDRHIEQLWCPCFSGAPSGASLPTSTCGMSPSHTQRTKLFLSESRVGPCQGTFVEIPVHISSDGLEENQTSVAVLSTNTIVGLTFTERWSDLRKDAFAFCSAYPGRCHPARTKQGRRL